MAKNADKNTLLDQREALKSYLEALLEEEVEGYSPPPQQQIDNSPEHSASQGVEQQKQVIAPVQNITPAQPIQPSVAESPVRQISAWAEFPLQVLSFEINGHLYAAPLKHLNGIVPMPDKITQVPSKIAWFLGLFRNRGVNVKVIDVEKLWHTRSLSGDSDSGSVHDLILLIDQGRFGFRVNKVKNVMNLREDDVQWRHDAGCNGVLCGNIRSNMASLLDINALSAGLNSGIWAGPR